MKKRAFLLAIFAVMIVAFCSACGDSDIETAEGADERVAAAYVDGVTYFGEQTELAGFWDASAAYGFLEEDTYGKTLNLKDEDEHHRGAKILAVMMVGENPYNYQGVDMVQDLLDHGTDGRFAIPVLNFMGLQAAGAEMDDATEKTYVDYCCQQLTEMVLGPDIGGWALVALVNYMDDPAYEEQIAAAMEHYISVVSKDLVSGSMGSAGITSSSVVLGLTALTSAGYKGYDPTKDSPWIDSDPIALMYQNLTEGEENVSDYYKGHYYLSFADLYGVLYEGKDMTWIRCGVNRERLEALIAEAEALTGNADVDAALAAVAALSEEQRSAAVPSWGRLYYDLYDAVKAASK